MKEALKNRPPVSTSIDDDAQKIYREILDVVKQNSPSLQSVQGRMVGYNGEKKHKKLEKVGKDNTRQHNSRNLARIRLSEDRESITTSLDSYQFAPTSPWGHAFPSRYNRFGYPVFPQRNFGLPSPAGPVSFAGFSPAPSNLTSSSAGPASFQSEMVRKKKKKKGWFKFF